MVVYSLGALKKLTNIKISPININTMPIKVTTIHGKRQLEFSVLTPMMTRKHRIAYTDDDTINVTDVYDERELSRTAKKQVTNSSPAIIVVPVSKSKQQQLFILQKYIILLSSVALIVS